MMADLAAVPDANARAAPRTNLFLAAVLHAPGTSSPAKVRNLSANGALVEAAVLPPTGTSVHLVRGPLSVEGIVTWSTGQRCGVQFAALISVREWMGQPVNQEQQRAQEIAGLASARTKPAAAPPTVIPDEPQRPPAADKLALVARLLERVEQELTADPASATLHAPALAMLALARQTLGAM